MGQCFIFKDLTNYFILINNKLCIYWEFKTYKVFNIIFILCEKEHWCFTNMKLQPWYVLVIIHSLDYPIDKFYNKDYIHRINDLAHIAKEKNEIVPRGETAFQTSRRGSDLSEEM